MISVTIRMTNDSGLTSGTAPENSRSMALVTTSNAVTSSSTPIASAASVSTRRWPKGWFSSAGRPAMRLAISPSTLPVPSITEWKPSAVIASAPVSSPMTILPPATSRLSTRVMMSTRST